MEILKRIYTNTDSELSWFADEFADVLHENLSALSEYGLTLEKIEAFEQLALAFRRFLPDDYYARKVTTAVNERNAKRKEIAGMIQSAMVRIQNVVPHNLLQYKRFTAAVLKDCTVGEFTDAAVDFAGIAADDLPALAEEGFTSAKLEAIDEAAATYIALAKEVRRRMHERAVAAHDRVESGNKLYALVKKYAGYGKDFYADNPAQYNRFIIYADAGISRKTPVVSAVELIDGNAEAVFEQEVTSMRMYVKYAEEDDYEEIYRGENKPVYVGENHKKIYIKTQGRNRNGWGKARERIFEWGVTS